MTTGNLFIITAASGAGKTSLIKALLAKDEHLKLSISHTTRNPRPSEVNGVDYHFVDDVIFLRMLGEAQFLESAEVHDARYGTSQSAVEAPLQAGFDVILEIDWQGAAQVRRLYPQAISIFVLPPSIEALERRLNGRGQDSAEVIAKRVAAARTEMRHVSEFDYVTINDDFDVALQDISAIIRAQRLVSSVQLQRYASLIQTLT
ncbi:guanylate kinase [Methylotenera sp.]|jgi:guanylate kinase|uniref:guanylate kinase n=1 Tax=Methylotenera sp. TaxID=2051956 RepID=UPI002716BDAA|nr:guanylate kinase [Methylotenera sp.]MDO9393174.1 guanylate kinase [Methylotenera sp.]MDP1522916.1 guanylate kinase [Methylotenera sp.]MDP2072381.1 guanylate kinase [Methylotenera sp.]MDP3005624.1 guanylate kinase [Methylotenera sp.]MDZ4211298.1 guanylate kinase [Methylotenera sp.]